MPADRITQLSIEGMRCIDSIQLDLKEFTVLIGENGTGKSTVIEALELLRRAGTESPLLDKVYQHHDGVGLVRSNASYVHLEAAIEGEGPRLTYSIRLLRDGPNLKIDEELVRDTTRPGDLGLVMWRTGSNFKLLGSDGATIDNDGVAKADEAIIAHARFLNTPQLVHVQRALASIEVHTALDLRRRWSHTQASQTARSSNLARPVDRVEPGGANLVNVFAKLKNQRNWRETLGRLQVSLGEIEDVLLVSEPSGGTLSIWLRWANGLEVPLSGLSDGQISVLALVAIQQLVRSTPPSVIAIDEPEIHLHPGLTARVAVGLQEMSEDVPILVGTQSDSFLNAIDRPEDTVVLCQLDDQRRTVLHRPDRERLRDWLTEFKGLGAVRSEGLQSAVFPASQ